MSNETIMLMDVSGLCHRFFHSVKYIEASEVPHTIMYKMFDTIQSLGFKFKTNKFVFLFEGGNLKRKEYFPEYKIKRAEKKQQMSLVEQEAYSELQAQMIKLKSDLQLVGFNNCYSEVGYEADDLIAVITKSDCLCSYVIVSSDEDLYQLLSSNVSQYSPISKNPDGTYGKLVTYEMFKHMYNYNAENWWKIKALAGCSTDEVIGVFGVGEKKAIEFFNKTMKKDSKVYLKLITEESKAIYKHNVPLVKLPYEGCSPVSIVDNCFNKKNFLELCETYRMYSFLEPEELKKWKYFFTGMFNGITDEIRNNRRKLTRFSEKE